MNIRSLSGIFYEDVNNITTCDHRGGLTLPLQDQLVQYECDRLDFAP
jgi:hypothetical protein